MHWLELLFCIVPWMVRLRASTFGQCTADCASAVSAVLNPFQHARPLSFALHSRPVPFCFRHAEPLADHQHTH